MRKIFIFIFIALGLLVSYQVYLSYVGEAEEGNPPAKEKNGILPSMETIAENLEVPWEMGFLPNGDLLVTERRGVLRVIGENPKSISVSGVIPRGEGGLLGLALHPDYESNKFIYLYFTSEKEGRTVNKVTRYSFDGSALSNPKIIIGDIPGGTNHDGGRIAFGPDGFLYIATGDAGNSSRAQDKNSLAGKILRVKDGGEIPEDNSFQNAVYSYGHRNPQGLAWDEDGNLWATEHGRSGVLSGYDELNLIEKGGNYGWPEVEGDESGEGMISPVIHSGASYTWAPSGLAYFNGKLYFAGLRGEALYEAPIISEGRVGEIAELFKNELGRLRIVSSGSDGYLYIGTSNRDGRGRAREGDDKIMKMKF